MDERILALDVGDVRIGIAVSDEGRIIAQPVEVYRRVGYGPDARHIAKLCEGYNTRNVLCGLPRNMDGSEGFQAQKVRDFAAHLEAQGLVVFFQDERMSTVTAENVLISGGMQRKDRRNAVDKVAAVVILQQWLDRGDSSVDINNRNEETNMELNNSIIELVDEQGESVAFEHLMTVEHENDYYIVLMAAEEDEAEETEEGEVIILKMEKDDNDEDCYVSIEDEAILQAVFDKFVAAIEEEDDAAFGEYEEDEAPEA